MMLDHSFLPNDAEFDLIEAVSRRKQHIYVPGDWKESIMNAKRKCLKFEVIKVKNSDLIFAIAQEQSITNRKKNTEELVLVR